MMKSLFPLALLLFVASTVTATESRVPYIDAVAIDSGHRRGQLVASAIRAIDLGSDGLLLIEHARDAADTSPMVGEVVRADGTVSTRLRAADFLPPDKTMPKTVGQIYGAAIIDDGHALAVSIGWTNAKGRNINGIAILDRAGNDWVPRRVIVLNGSVRDLASGPGNTIFAVTTDVARSRAQQAVSLITVLDSAGNFYGQLFPASRDPESLEERGLHARLQRVGGEVVLLDAAALTATFIATTPVVQATPSRDDGVFIYPHVTGAPLDAKSRTLNFRAAPDSTAAMRDVTIQDMAVGPDKSITVLRKAFDGNRLHEYASTYRADGSRSDWHGEVAWQNARVVNGSIEAVEEHPGSLFLVRVRLPQ